MVVADVLLVVAEIMLLGCMIWIGHQHIAEDEAPAEQPDEPPAMPRHIAAKTTTRERALLYAVKRPAYICETPAPAVMGAIDVPQYSHAVQF